MNRLRRYYIWAGYALSPVMLLGLKLYTSLTRRPRVRVVVMNEYDEILLVRGIVSYRGRWALPGGGVNYREQWSAAASRELYEETGIKVAESSLEYVRTIKKGELKLDFVAPLFRVSVLRDDLPSKQFNPIEIADVAWFGLDDLPESTTALVRAVVDESRVNKSNQDSV